MGPQARRLARYLMHSEHVPFWVRSRLWWRREQRTWIARPPETFSGKVRWKMLKDRRPLLTTFADKVAVRAYVARTVGAEYLTTAYAVTDDVAELERGRLPREFVAKASHGSGGVWIVSDDAPEGMHIEGSAPAEAPDPGDAWHRILTRPDALDWDTLRSTLGAWLSMRFRRPEWAYVDVPPRILVEEVLKGANGDLAREYKIFVFHGEPRVVQVHTDRFGEHRQNLYLRDWTPLAVHYRYPPSPDPEPRPASLDQMLGVAAALGRETDFVRVDLYDADGRIVFGELTSYPDAGDCQFVPESFDEDLGRWWTLPSSYRTLVGCV